MIKVLVVDDDVKVVKVITRFLCQQRLFEVDTAVTGDEALTMARSGVYEIILLDIMLPTRSGFDVISGLRALGVHSLILVLSARNMIRDKVYALSLGADDYMVKTIDLKELLARIQTLLRRRFQSVTNFLSCQNLVLNLENMSVKRRQKRLDLSNKELDILRVLLQNKNKIVSRNEVVLQVWGKGECDLDSNTLDVHLKKLRKKVHLPEEKNSIIETVRGRGYIIRD